MCNRRCLCSNMISMLCTAFWVPSRAIQTIRCCPLPESFSLILDWMGYMLDFLVDHVEEHVDLDGSQFSGSILERWYSAHASQQNVVILEFGSPCSPRSALFAHDLNCHDQQRVSPFFHEVFLSPKLNVSLSWQERVWQPSVRSCAISTLRLLLSSDERVWVLLEHISNHSNSQLHFAIPVSCQSRSNWICKNVTRFSMCVPNAWRPVSAARHSYGTA